MLEEDFANCFRYDHNLITEEFNFYEMLAPSMQTDLVNFLFQDVLDRFSHLFAFCELGFRNELIIQMFSRRWPSGKNIIPYGKGFDKICFLMNGKIDILTRSGLRFFRLEPGSVFGDYQLLFKLKSVFQYVASSDEPSDGCIKDTEVRFMGVHNQIFENLLELYPKTQQALQHSCLIKREILIHYAKMHL